MLLFLYGPDTYRSWQKLKEIIQHYQKIHKSGLNLRFLNLKEKNFQDFKEEVFSTPMFSEKKLIILEEAFSNENFKENFLKFPKKIWENSKNIILFYERGLPQEKDALFLFLKKEAKYQKFDFLKGEKLENWVKEEFKKLGEVKIEKDALEELINFVGEDTWRMANEIRKLISYKKGEIIKKEDVEILVKPKMELDIFETIDFLAQKNKKKALTLLHHHLEKGANPLYLFSLIISHFRNLLIIKSLSQKYRSFSLLSEISGLSFFVVKKIYFQGQKFKIEELKKIYQKIFQIDLEIKTGKLEPETALDLLIAQI